MSSVVLPSSPLAGGKQVTIGYRQEGHGPVLLFLHGGWGYEVYPIDVGAFTGSHTVVIPDRSGYGRSTDLEGFAVDFHFRAALETLALLDALGLERAVWWGHSDGAVIAALAAIHAPEHVTAAILEAVHYSAVKPRSRAFFQRMASDPDSFGESIRGALAAEHGERRWRTILRLDGQAWLDLAAGAATPDANLYNDQLRALRCPTLVVHGGEDPRSEPGELDALLMEIPHARLSLHPDAGHSPHSESTRDAVTSDVIDFLDWCVPPARARQRFEDTL